MMTNIPITLGVVSDTDLPFVFFGTMAVVSFVLLALKKRLAAGLIFGSGLLILVAAALPGFLPPSSKAIHNGCLSNLKSIEGAKDDCAAKGKGGTNVAPTDADLFGEGRYLRSKPICPAGGIYTIGGVGQSAECSKTSIEHK